MTKLSTSYLFIRNGIFYFQVRIPQNLQQFYGQKNGIFRKSTKTRNQAQAKRIARIWWVELMARRSSSGSLTEIDIRAETHQKMVDHGRKFVAEFEKTGIDFNDTYAMEDFLQRYSTSDLECFIAAYQYLNKFEPSNSSVKERQDSITLEPIAGKLLSEVMDEWVLYNTKTKSGKKAWSLSTERKYIPQISLFVKMMGNPVANRITQGDIREKYKKKLPKIPVRMTVNRLFR